MRTTRRWITALMVVATAGSMLGACNTSEPRGDVGHGPAPGEAEKIFATDNTFATPVIEAKAGDELVVEITNMGDENHEWRVEDLGLTTGTIEPGEAAHARLIVPKGTTEYVCSYHGGMSGVIKGG